MYHRVTRNKQTEHKPVKDVLYLSVCRSTCHSACPFTCSKSRTDERTLIKFHISPQDESFFWGGGVIILLLWNCKQQAPFRLCNTCTKLHGLTCRQTEIVPLANPRAPKLKMLRSEVLTEAADTLASNIRHIRLKATLKLTDWDVLSHSFLHGAVTRLFS